MQGQDMVNVFRSLLYQMEKAEKCRIAICYAIGKTENMKET